MIFISALAHPRYRFPENQNQKPNDRLHLF